jgi:hypothetical protein
VIPLLVPLFDPPLVPVPLPVEFEEVPPVLAGVVVVFGAT